jgi:hypothetical protein
MYQHQQKKRPKLLRESAPEDRDSAHKMGESQKFLRRKFPVRPLVAEEHADDRSHRKRVQNQGLLPGGKSETRQVTEDQRKPGAPDEKLEHHHEEEPAFAGRNNVRHIETG